MHRYFCRWSTRYTCRGEKKKKKKKKVERKTKREERYGERYGARETKLPVFACRVHGVNRHAVCSRMEQEVSRNKRVTSVGETIPVAGLPSSSVRFHPSSARAHYVIQSPLIRVENNLTPTRASLIPRGTCVCNVARRTKTEGKAQVEITAMVEIAPSRKHQRFRFLAGMAIVYVIEGVIYGKDFSEIVLLLSPPLYTFRCELGCGCAR